MTWKIISRHFTEKTCVNIMTSLKSLISTLEGKLMVEQTYFEKIAIASMCSFELFKYLKPPTVHTITMQIQADKCNNLCPARTVIHLEQSRDNNIKWRNMFY